MGQSIVHPLDDPGSYPAKWNMGSNMGEFQTPTGQWSWLLTSPRLQDHVIGILKGTWDLAAPCLRPPPSGTAFPPAVRSTFPSTFGRQEVKEARRILGLLSLYGQLANVQKNSRGWLDFTTLDFTWLARRPLPPGSSFLLEYMTRRYSKDLLWVLGS